MEALQGLEVSIAIASQAKRTAHEDRLVPARQVELVHRLHVQIRRQPFAHRLLLTDRDHVRGDVATVYVQPGSEVGEEQPTGPARDVERRLAVVLDELLEVGDLVRPKVVVEL